MGLREDIKELNRMFLEKDKELLTKQLHDLRMAVKSKKFHEAEELFKEIESVKVQLKALEKE